MEKNLSCEECGGAKKPENKFCSLKCYYEARRKIIYIRTCPTCGKEFSFKNGAYARLGRMKYCSHECKTREILFDEKYFLGELTPDKLFTLGQILVCAELYKTSTIIVTSDKETLDDLQNKLGSTYSLVKTGLGIYKIKFISKALFDSLVDLGITNSKFYQEVPRDDLWEGMKATHCYKEVDNLCTFTSDSRKISRWIQDKFDTEIITKLYRYHRGSNKLFCQYINVWEKK